MGPQGKLGALTILFMLGLTAVIGACSPAPPISATTTPAHATATLTLQLAPTATSIPLPEAAINQIAWSPDGKMIAAVTRRGIVVYDRATLSPFQTIDQGEYAESVSFSPDAARLACICGEGLIKIWDVKSGQLLKTLADEKFYTRVAFNPNGAQLAGGDFDGRVKVWDANGDKLLFTLTGPVAEVSQIAFSADGARILSGSGANGTVKMWDARTGQLLNAFPEFSDFLGIEFSPHGTRMASTNQSGDVIKVWDMESGALITTVTQIRVFQFGFANDSKTIVCLCGEGILAWDASNGKLQDRLADYDPDIYHIASSPDGKQLAMGMRDGSVKVMPLGSGLAPNPLLHKTALGGFPFPIGTTWVYLRVQYDQVPGSPSETITATNRITETVVRVEGNAPSQEYLHRQTATLVSAPPGWQDNSANFDWELWYRFEGSQVFSSPEGYRQSSMLVYDFPFTVGNSWCPEQPPPSYNPGCGSMGGRTVQNRTSYTTPVGSFDDCYEISQDINSGGTTEWFCNGIGVVARKYDHSGTRFGFQDTLVGFSLGALPP